MNNRKLILISNDDGIDYPGIKVLTEIMKPYGDILVVAPKTGQSATSHSINSTSPLFVNLHYKEEGITAYSVTGTPVDCVKLALQKILKCVKPDLMVSGINHGSNAAINVVYSGTMGAAIEASLHGIPSVGFSTTDHNENANMDIIKKYAPAIIEKVLEKGLPFQTALNVNYPNIPIEKFKGYRICKQTVGFWLENFIERQDPYKNTYYWYSGQFNNYEPDNVDSDENALANDYAAIVPVKPDFTEYNFINELKKWNL